jgi:hypothetical protein
MHPSGESNVGGWFAAQNGVKLTMEDHDPAPALLRDFTFQ